MKKLIYLLYGIFCYCLFCGTVLYAIGFVGNLFVTRSMDSRPQTTLLSAVLINISLLGLLALLRSMLTRPVFRQWWIKNIPLTLERSTQVLLISLYGILLMWLWQPMGGMVWQVEDTVLKTVLTIAYLSGWSIVFTGTFLLHHFDLFGLRQVWCYYQEVRYTSPAYRLPIYYKLVRHPLYLGFLVASWATPAMTMAHLLLAIFTTGYILLALQSEERLEFRVWSRE